MVIRVVYKDVTVWLFFEIVLCAYGAVLDEFFNVFENSFLTKISFDEKVCFICTYMSL